MKKILAFLIAIGLILSMVGCNPQNNESTNILSSEQSKNNAGNSVSNEQSKNNTSNSVSNDQSKIDNSSSTSGESVAESSSVNSDTESKNNVSLIEESRQAETHEANFYIPEAQYGEYNIVKAKYDGTINGLIAKLCEMRALPKGLKVISFEIKDDKIAYIDLSEEFENGLAGTLGEGMTMIALVNTIIDCYDVDAVRYTVNGRNASGGHIDHDKPVPFFNKD